MPAPNTRPLSEITEELHNIDQAEAEMLLEGADGVHEPEHIDPQSAADTHPEEEFEARRKGWRPQSEYTGPEGKWVDAKTFLQRGERFTKKLENEIAALRQQVASFEGTRTQFRKFFDDAMARKDKEFDEAITNLRRQKLEATREGDDDRVLEIEDRLELTQQQRKEFKAEGQEASESRESPAAEVATPQNNPVMAEWAEATPWFNNDKILSEHAMLVAKSFRDAGDKSTGRPFLDRVAAKVEEDFPRRTKEASAKTRQNSADGAGAPSSAASSSPSSARASVGGKTLRDLPPEDLKMAREFIRDGLYTEQTFLASYFQRNK